MVELLAAFIGGGALTALIKGSFDIWKAKVRNDQRFPDAIRRMNSIYHNIQGLKSEINCNRVKIIAAKNGGGIPMPGRALYLTVLYEAYDSDLEPMMDWWNQRRVDEQYVLTLAALEEHGIITVLTETMKSGMLKDAYRVAGIEGSIFVKIKASDNRYYIMSCSFKNQKEMTLAARVHILDYVEKIKELI